MRWYCPRTVTRYQLYRCYHYLALPPPPLPVAPSATTTPTWNLVMFVKRLIHKDISLLKVMYIHKSRQPLRQKCPRLGFSNCAPLVLAVIFTLKDNFQTLNRYTSSSPTKTHISNLNSITSPHTRKQLSHQIKKSNRGNTHLTTKKNEGSTKTERKPEHTANHLTH